MPRGLEVPKRLARLREGEHAVDHGPRAADGDGPVHVLEHRARPDDDPLDAKSLEAHRVRVDSHLVAREHADQRDRSSRPSRLDRLIGRPGAAHLDDVVDARASGELEHPVRPFGRRDVVDRLPGAERPYALELLVARRGGDHARPAQEPELQREDRDSACPLHEDRLSGLRPALHEERVPGSHGRACEGRGLLVGEVAGRKDEAVLVEDDRLGKHAVEPTSQRRGTGRRRVARDPALEERGRDTVSHLHPRDTGPDLDDLAGTIRARKQRELDAAR